MALLPVDASQLHALLHMALHCERSVESAPQSARPRVCESDVGTIKSMPTTIARGASAKSIPRRSPRATRDSRRRPVPFLEAKAALQENLATRRARLQLSQRALAARSGVNVAYITQIETGNRNPTLLILGRLALALETDIATLLRTATVRTARASRMRYSTRGRKPG